MLGRLTLGLFFLLLVWGNLVAGMKAGLGCPDWPLCHGRLVPPFRWDIYMEFGHRVIAALSTLSLLAFAHFRFREYKGAQKAVPLLAVGLLALEIVLGGMVVLLELPVRLTTVHFMLGLTVFMLVLYMETFRPGVPARPLSGASPLFIIFGIVVFSQAALGAYVRHSDAGLACPDFPLCMGRFFPPIMDGKVLAHFTHRLAAYFILLTAAALYASAAVDPRMHKNRTRAGVLLGLVAIQILVGGGVVLTGLHYGATAAHMAVALAILIVVAGMWSKEATGAGEAV